MRIVVTGGSSPDDITPAGPARLLVLVTPFAAQPAARYREGIKIITDRQERYLPEAKTINYVPAIVALRRARQAGAVEAIYVNRAGHALEGTTTNLFAVFGDRLVTRLLPGVTRQVWNWPGSAAEHPAATASRVEQAPVLDDSAGQRPARTAHAAGAARPAAGGAAASLMMKCLASLRRARKSALAYVFGFYGIIDLLAILPGSVCHASVRGAETRIGQGAPGPHTRAADAGLHAAGRQPGPAATEVTGILKPRSGVC